MKRLLFLFLTIAFCLILAVSCNENEMTQTGILEIAIGVQEASKGISPVSMDVACYSVKIVNPEGETVESVVLPADGGNASCRFSLCVGEYTVIVKAVNEEGLVIGEGASDVSVEAGKTVSCSVVVHEIQGKGTVSFSYAGKENDNLRVEIVDASMASVASLSLLFDGQYYSGTIELDNGFYMFTVYREDGTVLDSDTIRVVASGIVSESEDDDNLENNDTAAENLIKFGDMETGSASDWIEEDCSLKKDAGKGIGGSTALRVKNMETWSAVGLDLTDILERTKSYYIECWIKLYKEDNNPVKASIMLEFRPEQLQDYDEEWKSYSYVPTVFDPDCVDECTGNDVEISATEWVKLSGVIRPEDMSDLVDDYGVVITGAIAGITCFFRIDPAKGRQFWIDNVVVREISD